MHREIASVNVSLPIVFKFSSILIASSTKSIALVKAILTDCVIFSKAQGLEYDSVKVLISNEVEENITHNIFYTAITRAKKTLTIYWTPETEKKIVDSFKILNYSNDAKILKERLKISGIKLNNDH